MKLNHNKLMVACILIVIGVLLRSHFHLGDNVEFVTSGALVSAYYLGLGWGIVVPLTTMFLSDLIIGNTTIFLFTWSAYIIIGIAGYMTLKSQSASRRTKVTSQKLSQLVRKVAQATFIGIGASF